MGVLEVEQAIKIAELNEAYRQIVIKCKDMSCEGTPQCDNENGTGEPCRFRDRTKPRGCLKPIIFEVLKTARGIQGENEELFRVTPTEVQPVKKKRAGRPRRSSVPT